MKTVYTLLGLMIASAVVAQTTSTQTAAPTQGRLNAAEVFKNRDANKDNLLSKAEVSGTRIADAFDRLDTNKDGMLGLDEFQKGRDAMRDGRDDRRSRGKGPGSGNQDGMRGQMQAERMETRFKERDTNKDGFLSKTEFSAQMSTRFDALDANKDGKLSMDEIKANMRAMGKVGVHNAGAQKTN
jgi:Ca2+-binding EF-hand superfamily protein